MFRENRFCPTTSRLPEYYADEIRDVPGVENVIPIQITVNNCRASLDIVTFRGVPPEQLSGYAPSIEIIEGSYADWTAADDGALLGERFAQRRGLKPGEAFEAAGVRVEVKGILRSPNAQDNAVAYVHLPFLQQASRQGLGTVTQFNVRVQDPAQMSAVATAIDSRFETAENPTYTQPESAFFARAAQDLIELIGFTLWVALGAVFAVLGLITNSVLLVIRSRVKENAILQTLGYPVPAIVWLVLLEGILLGLVGGAIGVGAADLVLRWQTITFGNEGQLLTILPQIRVALNGMALAVGLGAVAAIVPAWTAVRQPLIGSLQS